MSSTITSADGTAIAYTAVGTGPALILVDGAFSYRAFNPTLQAIATTLADSYTVYTYDRRGRGESGDNPRYPSPADAVAAEVADLAAVIAHAGGSAYVCGFSSGAVLTLEAARAGLPITGIALYEPSFVVTGDRPAVPSEYRARLLAAIDADRRDEAVEVFMTMAVGMPAEYVAPMQQDPSWAGMTAVAHTLSNDAAIMADTMSGDPATLEKFHTVSTPALVVSGGNSDAWMASGSETVAKVLPNARHEVLPGQDHNVAPDALAPVLRGWLDSRS